MSRIIVKSLPKKITGQALEELFSAKGEVSDVQLKYNSQGKFRCFAFVGFKSEEQAAEACEYFNNTYVQNCKIKVELCKNERKEEPEQPKPEERKKSVKEEFEDLKDDTEFLEFLKVQRNVGDTKKIWDDELIMGALAKKYLKQKGAQEAGEDVDEQGDEENDEANKKGAKGKKELKPEEIFKYTVAIRKIPQDQRKKKAIKEFFAPLKPASIRIPKIKCLAYVSFKTQQELKQALEKHKSFMGKNQVHLQVMKSSDPKASQVEFNKHKGRIEKSVPVENIEEHGRLFVRNLNYQCTVEDLEQLFKPYGPTTEVNLPVDQLTQKIKGYAFITFMFPEHAKKAFNELDRSTFQGRLLHIIPAEVRENEFNPFDDASAFKKRKAAQLKGEATKSSNWNTLFLGQNAVANILSKKMNIDKAEFFKSAKNESIAARMALGETQLVNETRMFLEQNGVFLNCFNFENLKRSKTIFLIKHLPTNTNESELKEFLSTFGKIKRLILPPSCITAIVEMENPQVAYDMFRKLAYKNFKNIPLYLEWAPINVLDRNATDVVESVGKEPKAKKLKKLEYAVDEEPEKEDSEVMDYVIDKVGTRTDESEKSEEKKADKKDKKKEKKSGKKDSDKKDSTENEKSEDEPANEVAPKEEEEKEENVQRSHKILVRNVPFEASVKDVRQLFSAFGDLQFVRLPKKLHGTGSHRGFAFVEFVNRTDAKKAFGALSQSTHLYGRRLVLEWAKTEASNSDEL